MPIAGIFKDLFWVLCTHYYVERESLFLAHSWSCDYNWGDGGEKNDRGVSEWNQMLFGQGSLVNKVVIVK